ncbi:MAG: hypothetical protein U0931_39750 [Vulcanimicrobiota bacterium]
MALFGLITALIGAAFTLGHRFTRVYHQLSTSERECTRCLARLGELLKKSSSQTLKPTSPADNACWVLSASPLNNLPDVTQFDDTTGELLYHKWLAVYLATDGRVVAAEKGLASGPAAFETAMLDPIPPALSTFLATPRQRVLASSIRRFVVSGEGGRLFRVDVEAQSTESGNPATRYILSSSFPGQ